MYHYLLSVTKTVEYTAHTYYRRSFFIRYVTSY